MSSIFKKKEISNNPILEKINWANVTSIYALIYIFGKSVLVPKKLLGSILIILILSLGSLVMVPYYYSYGATSNLGLFLISSFIYGSIFYSFRKSTLFDNIRETNLSKIDIYFSIFIIMFLFTAFNYLFIILFFIIGLAVDSNLFMDDWFFRDIGYGKGGHLISELNAQLMFWWYIAFIFLNFSLFYLFQNIASSKKSFYLFVLFYFILLMLFGNALMTPYISDNIFLIEEKFPNHLSGYVNGVPFNDVFLGSNIDFPFDVSFNIKMSSMLKEKIANEKYFSAIMTILTPHYWINIYSSNVMKSTCLSVTSFDPQTGELFPKKLPGIAESINDFKVDNYIYSEYSFENAKIWSLQNEISWILGMYLWMAYFVFFAFVGMIISRLTYYKN